MTELMRFRIARAPQRTAPDLLYIIKPDAGDTAVSTADHDNVLNQISDEMTVSAAALEAGLGGLPHFDALLRLDTALSAHWNSIDAEALRDLIPTAVPWGPLRLELFRKLEQPAVLVNPAVNARLLRLILVAALCETILDPDCTVEASDEIYALLRWRKVVLGDQAVKYCRAAAAGKRAGVDGRDTRVADGAPAWQPGFSDLYVIREEWMRYEPGEPAFVGALSLNGNAGPAQERHETMIDGVLAGALKALSQESISGPELQEASRGQPARDIRLAAGHQDQRDASAQYGPTQVDTGGGGLLDFSRQQADLRGMTLAHETVTRAVNKVHSRVAALRARAVGGRVMDERQHDDEGSIDPGRSTADMYRWVNKISRVETWRYPHRFFVEFVVPEPAALHRRIQGKNASQPPRVPPPLTIDGLPTGAALEPRLLDRENYLSIAARYATRGIEPPPDEVCIVATNLDCDAENVGDRHDNDSMGDKQRYSSRVDIAVPDGYRARSWSASVLTWFNWRDATKADTGWLRIAVGAGSYWEARCDFNAEDPSTRKDGLEVGPISVGTIPIAVQAINVFGYSANIEITCELRDRVFRIWQIKTFEAIAEAHDRLKRQHEEASARHRENALPPLEDAADAVGNRQVVVEELKRQVIELLLNSPSKSIGEMAGDPPKGPSTDAGAAEPRAAEIGFLEQAFEWENLSYALYPYFWADRSRWSELAAIVGADQEFVRFLRAGAARVIVPARPGFGDQVNFYLNLGLIWGGGPVPAPDDPAFLSVAEEIKAIDSSLDDGEKIDEWEIAVPTELLWKQDDNTLPAKEAASGIPILYSAEIGSFDPIWQHPPA